MSRGFLRHKHGLVRNMQWKLPEVDLNGDTVLALSRRMPSSCTIPNYRNCAWLLFTIAVEANALVDMVCCCLASSHSMDP